MTIDRFIDALAQLETAGGKKTIKGPNGEDSFNLFNIKGKTGFRAVDKAEGSNDAYRTYANVDASKADLKDLLARRYPKALEAKDAREFFSALKAGGYATDPNYIEKGVNVARSMGMAVLGANEFAAAPADDVWNTKLADLRKQREAEAQAYGDSSLLDKARAIAPWTGFTGAIIRGIADPEFAPTPGFTPDPALLQGMNEDELQEALATRSKEEFDYVNIMQGHQRSDMAEVASDGQVTAFAAGMLASLPEAILTGKAIGSGLSALSLGSRAAMAAGNAGRAVGLSAIENVGGNIAMTAAEDAFTDNRVGLMDYPMAAAGGLLGVAGDAGALTRGAGFVAERALGKRLLEEAAAAGRALEDKARVNLGADASREALVAEMQRLQSEQTRTVSTPPAGRRVMPDMDKAIADAEAEATAVPEKPTAVPEKPTRESPTWPPKDLATIKRYNEANTPLAHNMDRPQMRRLITGSTGGELPDIAKDLDKLPLGVSEVPNIPPKLRDTVNTMKGLLNQFMPAGSRVLLTPFASEVNWAGAAYSRGYVHVLGVRPAGNSAESLVKGVHEVGHAVVKAYWNKLPDEYRLGVQTAYDRFVAAMRADNTELANNMRFSTTDMTVDRAARQPTQQFGYAYGASKDEFLAEQFVRYVEEAVATDNKAVTIPAIVRGMLKDMINAVVGLFKEAKKKHYLGPEPELRDMFEAIRKKEVEGGYALPAENLSPALVPQNTAAKFGLDMLPQDTPAQVAEVKVLTAMYERADSPSAPWNNIPANRLDSLTKYSDTFGSTALILLRSENPVARMMAYELLESTTGAGGRNTSAAMSKYLQERKLMGNIVNEYQQAYVLFRNSRDGSMVDDFWKGDTKRQFDKLVSEEIEYRRQGTATNPHPAVTEAANRIEAAYDRLRVEQVNSKTTGWGALPTTSKGYMPHKLSAERVRNMTRAEEQALFSSLTDQFIGTEGWDVSFSSNLAAKYIDRVRKRATGGHGSGVAMNSPGAADIVEDALTAMGLTRQEVREQMTKYMRGAAGHTKQRLNLDLMKEYTNDDGTTFRLLDFYEQDNLGMVRAQAQRVSGEVALAGYGVMGRNGLGLIRRAMEFGYAGKKAQPNEFAAWDQVSAEFLGEPFGNNQVRWAQNTAMATSLMRMGGIGFTQAAEYINAAAHIGIAKTLSSIGSFARLRREVAALAGGEKVDNPLLSSLEVHGGAEFGTDSYKLQFPFDNPTSEYQVDGKQSLGIHDRLLRGGMHAQGKLTFWRAVHSAQQRGMAEQIVLKSLRFIRDGGEDVALADMGITPEVAAKMKANLDKAVTFDGNGRVVTLDVSKFGDEANAYIQAVHRGVGQIIQQTFIGETGKWVHNDYLKLLGQFRAFGLTSVEKQWGRNRANHGVAKALGILVGSMAAAAPLYIARVYASSVGRDDQDEYLQRRLQPQVIARATMNFVASSGLSGELLDGLSAVAGLQTTGGRAGVGGGVIDSIVPAAGAITDVVDAVSNTQEGTDPTKALNSLPYSRLPYLIPVLNLMGEQ